MLVTYHMVIYCGESQEQSLYNSHYRITAVKNHKNKVYITVNIE
jgi:hypothetical protein